MSVPLRVRMLPAVAERAWFTPPPARAVDRVSVEGANPIAIPLDGVELQGFSIGSGPLVILAHGWGGRAAQMATIARAVAGHGMLAVAVNAPGHGGDRRKTSSAFEMAASLNAIADVCGEPQAVVAHSLGAMAAVLAFEDLPPPRSAFLAPVLDAAAAIEVFTARARLAPWTARSLHRRLRDFAGDSWPALTAGADLDFGQSELLVAHDPDDRQTPFATSAVLAAKRPNTELVPLPGAGHNGLLDHPDAVAAVVRHLGGIRAQVGEPPQRQSV